MNYPSPEEQSIFGDTYSGIPNPNVPFQHAYNTRYHGPNYKYPVFDYTYKKQSFMTPFHGMGDSASTLTASTTGSMVLDAVIGAGVGYSIAQQSSDRTAWAIGGAIVMGLAGTLGLIGLVGTAVYARK